MISRNPTADFNIAEGRAGTPSHWLAETEFADRYQSNDLGTGAKNNMDTESDSCICVHVTCSASNISDILCLSLYVTLFVDVCLTVPMDVLGVNRERQPLHVCVCILGSTPTASAPPTAPSPQRSSSLGFKV